MKKILVTGGLGFIGSNLVKKLDLLGYEVVSVDDLSSCRTDYIDFKSRFSNIEYVECCFGGDSILNRVTSKEFDTVFHVAAIPRVGYSVEEPYKTTNVNIAKTVKLLESCVGNVNRFIFSSSSSVYGGADIMPTPTDYCKDPKSPYAWQKSCIEDLISILCDLHDFDAVSLRYFNVFGPGQFGGSAYSTAVSAWCHAIKNGTALRKDGTGDQSRDLCYIDNVVNANILSMNCDRKFCGERYNVACGDRTSNNEILDFLQKSYGPLDIEFAPFRPGDVMHTQADISRSVLELGYNPNIRFWEGLNATLKWWDL